MRTTRTSSYQLRGLSPFKVLRNFAAKHRKTTTALALVASLFALKTIHTIAKTVQYCTDIENMITDFSAVETMPAEEGFRGEDLYFRGQVFRSVRPGDVICRSIHIGWGDSHNKVTNRAVAAGVPGFCEHAAVFIGDGKILNIGPDDPNLPIMEQTLDRLIGLHPVEQVVVLRMSNDPTLREKAIHFLRFHQFLGAEGRFHFSRWTKHSTPFTTNNGSHWDLDYYYPGFNCVSGILLAYQYAEIETTGSLSQFAHRRHLPQAATMGFSYLLQPELTSLTAIAQNTFVTGYHLEQVAEHTISSNPAH